MKVLKLTSYDKKREDRAIWVNFDYAVFIKNRHTGTGEKIKGASVELLSGMTVDVAETAEDIVKALSVMDNKDYNRGVDDI